MRTRRHRYVHIRFVIALAGNAKTNGTTAAAKVSAAIPVRAFNGLSVMIFLRRNVEDTGADNQPTALAPSPQPRSAPTARALLPKLVALIQLRLDRCASLDAILSVLRDTESA